MKHRLRTLAVVAAAVGAVPAFAQGLSVGGSLGGSHLKGNDLGVVTDHSDTGYKLYLGWGFTPNVGVEAGYVDLGKFEGPTGHVKGQGEYLDAVGSVPLGMNFSALGRVGLFSGRLERDAPGLSDSDRGLSWKVGLGLQYDFSKNLGVRGEWERYRFDALSVRDDADLYSIGLNYKF